MRNGGERRKIMTTECGTAKATGSEQATSPWDAALGKLREWEPAWAEQCVKMTTNPWTEGVLPSKFIELVCIGLNAGRTNLNPVGVRRHIRAAIEAGATREEILFVLKVASVMSIHSCMFGVPILLEQASAGSLQDAGKLRAKQMGKSGNAMAAVEKMKAIGQWNEEWDSLAFFAPVWTDEYMAACLELYASSVFTRKEVELLCIAFDASYTHMYNPGTRHHIKNALKAGATLEEIMEVLKLCVVQGVQACNLAIPILAEELERHAATQNARA
jgi:alkylhydroperoxidase/carboxymuconolactone decarboxylase family protein YurZ